MQSERNIAAKFSPLELSPTSCWPVSKFLLAPNKDESNASVTRLDRGSRYASDPQSRKLLMRPQPGAWFRNHTDCNSISVNYQARIASLLNTGSARSDAEVWHGSVRRNAKTGDYLVSFDGAE